MPAEFEQTTGIIDRRKKKWPCTCSYLECKGIFLVPSLIAKQYDDWSILQFLLSTSRKGPHIQYIPKRPVQIASLCTSIDFLIENSQLTKPRVLTLVTVSHVMTQWPSWQSELVRSAPALAAEGKTWFCYVILHAQGLHLDVKQMTQLCTRSYRIRFVVQSL